MSKLDTTIGNLERKTNKVSGNVPSSAWTDDQYPSAKTLFSTYNNLIELMHPVGSMFITPTNTNPGKALGGTWVLLDKTFKNIKSALNDSIYWNNTNADMDTSNSSITLADHTFSVQLNLTPTANLEAALILGKLDLNSCGIKKLNHAVLNIAAASAKGNGMIYLKFDVDGTVSVQDVSSITEIDLSEDNSFYINLVQLVTADQILDEFCDKFYWQRIS